MVGLNHEFARELLWREYPTDQRGSFVPPVLGRVAASSAPQTTRSQREALRDIPPLHRWRAALRARRPRQPRAPGQRERDLVLVIRGELLKKYPNAVIYAQRARVGSATPDGTIDPAKERDARRPSTRTQPPPRDIVKTPLYEAQASTRTSTSSAST